LEDRKDNSNERATPPESDGLNLLAEWISLKNRVPEWINITMRGATREGGMIQE